MQRDSKYSVSVDFVIWMNTYCIDFEASAIVISDSLENSSDLATRNSQLDSIGS